MNNTALAASVDRLAERIARLEKAATQPPRAAWRPREVADMTGIGYEVVLNLIRTGELGSVPAGRLHIVPAAELERFLARGMSPAVRRAS